MTDKLTPEQRRRCMQANKGKDTKSELIVRRWLWADGWRYRVCDKGMLGKPDIVMRKIKTVIFINGCYWHGHNIVLPNEVEIEEGVYEITNSECCHIPQSNRDYWLNKIRNNKQRDHRNYAVYIREGWHVLVVWECMLKPSVRENTLNALSYKINSILLEMLKSKKTAEQSKDNAIPMSSIRPEAYNIRPYIVDDEESALDMVAEGDGETEI